MKRKLLASFAVIIILIGSITPIFGFLGSYFQTRHADAFGQFIVTAISGHGQSTSPLINNLGISAHNNVVTPTVDALTPSSAIGNCAITGILCGLVTFTGSVLTVPTAFLSGISGVALDYVLSNTIATDTYAKQDVTTPGASSFVVSGWRFVRDFTNIIFIFALFVIAFNLILGGVMESNIAGLEPKRAFALVIIMALLVNFSFFICRATIDVTNKIATVFYSQSAQFAPSPSSIQNVNVNNVSSSLTGSMADFYRDNTGVAPVALAIVGKINPQQLLLDTNTGALTDLSGYGIYLFICLMTAIFNIFLVYVFLSTAIFIVVRTIGLYFAIILSPAAFVSVAIPSLKRTAYVGYDDWLKQFLGLAFLAPVYIFFLYLAVAFLNISTLLAPHTQSQTGSGYIEVAAVIGIKLAIVGAVLIFGKNVAKDLSGKLGAAASTIVTGAVIGAVGLGAAVAGGAAVGEGFFGSVGAGARAGGRYIAERGSDVVDAGARKVLGDERVDQIKNRLGGLRNFNLSKMNARSAILGGAAALTGSATIGAMNLEAQRAGVLGRGVGSKYVLDQRQAALAKARDLRQQKSGNYDQMVDRAKNIAAIKAAKNKKVADIDQQLADIKTKMTKASAADKVKLQKQQTDLEKQKTAILNPAPVANPGKNPGGPNVTGTPTQTQPTTNPTTSNPVNPVTQVPQSAAAIKQQNQAALNQSGDDALREAMGGGAAVATAAAAAAATQKKDVKLPETNEQKALPEQAEGSPLIRNTFNGTGKFEEEKTPVLVNAAGQPVSSNNQPTQQVRILDANGKEILTSRSSELNKQSGNSNAQTNNANQQTVAGTVNQTFAAAQAKPVVTNESANGYEPIFGDAETDNTIRQTATTAEGGHKVMEEVKTSSAAQATELLNAISGGATTAAAVQSAPKRTFGDGQAAAPVYTQAQQERILNKAIASQEKQGSVQAGIDRKQQAIADAKNTADAKANAKAEAERAAQQQQRAAQEAIEKQSREAKLAQHQENIAAYQKQQADDKAKSEAAARAREIARSNPSQTAQAPVVAQKTESVKPAEQNKPVEQKEPSKQANSFESNEDRNRFIENATNLHQALNETARNLSQGDIRSSFIPDSTAIGLKQAQQHLNEAIESAKSGKSINHEALANSMNAIENAMSDIGTQRPSGINSDQIHQEQKTVNQLHNYLYDNLKAIHETLPEHAKSDFSAKTGSLLNQSGDAAHFMNMKANDLNNL